MAGVERESKTIRVGHPLVTRRAPRRVSREIEPGAPGLVRRLYQNVYRTRPHGSRNRGDSFANAKAVDHARSFSRFRHRTSVERLCFGDSFGPGVLLADSQRRTGGPAHTLGKETPPLRGQAALCSHEERCRRPASLHDGPRTRRRIRPSPGDRKLLAGRRHRGRIDDGNSEQLFAAQKTLTATAARMLSAVSMALLQPCE